MGMQGPMQVPSVLMGHSPMGQIGQIGQIGHVGHVGQIGHVSQVSQVSEEALREAVLLETLARLLREKMGNGQAVGGSGASTAIPPWRRTQESDIPPPIGSTPVENAERASPTEKVEAPLEKFIRVFGLDELAAKCLLKLQDDEAAFVIES